MKLKHVREALTASAARRLPEPGRPATFKCRPRVATMTDAEVLGHIVSCCPGLAQWLTADEPELVQAIRELADPVSIAKPPVFFAVDHGTTVRHFQEQTKRIADAFTARAAEEDDADDFPPDD